MSNYYQVTNNQFRWFGESLSSLASLYVLRKMHEKAQPHSDFRVTRQVGAASWQTFYIQHPGVFARANISGQRMDQDIFEGYFAYGSGFRGDCRQKR